MISRFFRHRAVKRAASLGGFLFLAACSSLPSIGPRTANGLPSHVDGSAGQVLRFCEKLRDAGDLTTAAAVCERAHRLNPDAPEPLLELAGILGDMGEPELSIETYRTILKTSPANADARYGLGRTYLNQGQADLALPEFQAALRSNPKDPRLYRAVGVASGLLGAHAEAQRVYRDGLLIAPEDTALRNNLGLSLVQSGRYDQGLRILESLAKDPNAGQESRENLLMAQGLAATARAEVRLAEVRAKEEAEAKAAALAAVQAASQAQPEAEDRADLPAAKPDEPARGAPAVALSYPRSSWPMDGPGADGAMPIGNLADKATPDRARRNLIARAPGGRPEPRQSTAPTALTAAVAAPSSSTPANPRSRAWTPDPAAETRTETLRASLSPTDPKKRQTARADFGGTSDAEAVLSGRPDAPVQTPKRQATTPAPARLVAKPPVVNPARETYRVQFASYTSEERAWRGWDSLRGSADGLLNGIEPDVRRADLGGDTGIVYRLRTGAAPKENARTLCAALKAKGVECLVVKSRPEVAESAVSTGRSTL